MTARRAPSDDHAAVESCVTDYFEAWFSADAARMRRAVHPELAKRGWIRRGAEAPFFDRDTSDSMVGFTTAGGGSKRPAAEHRFDIEVVDVRDDIASVTVRSPIYHEYLHLVRTDEGWRIIHSLWRLA
ncbi:MAG: nuclear transport factor 2 family protein [Chloroflexi bacterium]|nr:nuclear transport factor 2 family protein [Chloroflexota bacterium]